MPRHNRCPRFPSLAECRRRYNVADSQKKRREIVHQTEPNIPRFDDHVEPSAIFRRITKILEKHNRLSGFDLKKGVGFYITGDQWSDDRTMPVIVYGTAGYTAELITDLQKMLRRYFPLWRIDLSEFVVDDHILVYPAAVQNNDAVAGEPLAETLLRVNAHEQAWERRYKRYMAEERPGYRPPRLPPRLRDAKVVYNSTRELNENLAFFNTVPGLSEPSVEEYLKFEKDLVSVLERYGPVVVKNHLSDTNKEALNAFWLIRTNSMHWDRTRILVKYGRRKFTRQLVRDIRATLKHWPLWRVALDAEDERDVRFVYPDRLR